MSPSSRWLRLGLLTALPVVLVLACGLGSWAFTTSRLRAARSTGVFPSPAEGMLSLIESGYTGIQEAKIVSVQPETAPGGGPHVWFVTACVWADARSDGSRVGSATHDWDFPGSYFVNTREGWVLMPEESLPLFVGFWMRVFGLAGNDRVEPYQDTSIPFRQVCARSAAPVTAAPPVSTPLSASTVQIAPLAPTQRMRLIVDDDGSRDGTAALLYLLSQPEIAVAAVSISYGEAHPAVYVQHAGRLLDMLGLQDIPLGAGQDGPLAGGTPFPDWLRGLSDNFWGYPLPEAGRTYPFYNAPELMVSVIQRSPEPVTLFVSGPFTNLAQALQLDPTIREHIAAVYFMGGAVQVAGNIPGLLPDSDNHVAEWNILADPQAAQAVFTSGLALYMVPLDATHRVMLSQADLRPWRNGDEKAQVIADLYDILFNTYGFQTTEIFDLTAAVLLVQPAACEFQPLHLEVIKQAGPTLGQTKVVSNGAPNVHACLEPEAAQVMQNLNQTFYPH